MSNLHSDLIQIRNIRMNCGVTSENAANNLRCTPQIVRDKEGSEYLRCSIDSQAIQTYLNQMKRLLSEPSYELLRENKKIRDGNEYHITVIDPVEAKSCFSGMLSGIRVQEHCFTVLGLGTVRYAEKESWYVIVESASAKEFRASLNLAPKDFHITLGFNPSDIYDQSKGRNTLVTL